MNLTLENIKQAAHQLNVHEKTILAHELLREIDEESNVDVEKLWIEESERRLDAYLNGELEAIDGDEAMAKLRNSLR